MSLAWGRTGRQAHRWVGLAASLLLVVLAVSGVLLTHPAWLGAPAERTLSLAAHPGDAAVILRGTTSGLWRSVDGGASWQEAAMLLPLADVVAIAFAPDDTATVYAAGRDQGLVRSRDGGWIWEPAGLAGLPSRLRYEELAAGPHGRVHLWTDRGAFVSADGGETWTAAAPAAVAAGDRRAWLHDLHTGRLFGRAHLLANDLAAIALVLLVATGWVLWWLGRRRGRELASGHGGAAPLVVTVAVLVAAVLVALTVTLAHGAEPSPATRLDRMRVLMGTYARVSIWAPDSLRAELAADAAFAALVRVDSLMSLWRDDSDLVRVNRAAGRDTVVVAPEVIAVTRMALAVARDTGGAFDPTVLPLLELWGLHGDQVPDRAPSAAAIAACRALVDHRAVHVDSVGSGLHLARAGMRLDLGGIAKGHAVGSALAAAIAQGATGAVVDLGGNLGALGTGPGAVVEVRHPDDATATTGTVVLGDPCCGPRFVATSGAGERFLEIDARRYGHIVDPRTGYPVDHGVASVSVIGDDGALTDALATAMFVLGPREGMAVAARWPQCEVLFLGAFETDR